MNKHTAEPWKVMPDPVYQGQHPYHENRFIATDDALFEDGFDDLEAGELIASMRDGENQQANARRIVACVNACVGLADPAAEIAAMKLTREGWDVMGATLASEREAIKAMEARYASTSEAFDECIRQFDAQQAEIKALRECAAALAVCVTALSPPGYLEEREAIEQARAALAKLEGRAKP